VTTLIGQKFRVASIEAEKSFIGLGPSLQLSIGDSQKAVRSGMIRFDIGPDLTPTSNCNGLLCFNTAS